jgi:serine protease AprX
MSVNSTRPVSRRKAVWGPRSAVLGLACALLVSASDVFAAGDGARRLRAGRPNSYAAAYKLDGELSRRAQGGSFRKTRVIVEWQPGAEMPAGLRAFARPGGDLQIINGTVLDVPNGMLRQLAADPSVLRLHFDRPAFKHNYRTGVTTGSRAVQRALGYTGFGVGVAVIDSGITSWHDDLSNRSQLEYPFGNQRVARFVDFVNGQTLPYDDDGHGTHVAGIIAGNGFDSNGQRAGVAPDASLFVLKALDANGNGTISNVILSLDWVLAHHTEFNIRVVNLSVGAAIRESYWTDPLTLAAKRLVDSGVVVVAAAGNLGKNAAGEAQYGGIGAPANAPWVLTVGAYSTNGTTSRADDAMASFSSRGPTYLDWAAKPDLVAPGVGTVSLAAPGSNFYANRPTALLPGLVPTANLPYLSLSGTSMAAPVVSGTVALMVQANPALTPNAVKAILQYTAQDYSNNALTQGAGFLNTIGAIRLARFFATAQPGQPVPMQSMWSRHIVWGNHLLTGGVLDPQANAFALGTTWGVGETDTGDNIVWGMGCDGSCDNIVWGTDGGDNIVWGTEGEGDNIVWGTGGGDDNIVWGTACGGDDCDNIVWGTEADNIVWGTGVQASNIVWGMAGLDVDNIVWGMADHDNIVWGMVEGSDNIVWGTADGDNIVWGTAGNIDNIVWGTAGDDNIVWGMTTGADNIVWGTSVTGQRYLWDVSAGAIVTWDSLGSLFPRLSDAQIFSVIRALLSPPPPLPAGPGGPRRPGGL